MEDVDGQTCGTCGTRMSDGCSHFAMRCEFGGNFVKNVNLKVNKICWLNSWIAKCEAKIPCKIPELRIWNVQNTIRDRLIKTVFWASRDSRQSTFQLSTHVSGPNSSMTLCSSYWSLLRTLLMRSLCQPHYLVTRVHFSSNSLSHFLNNFMFMLWIQACSRGEPIPGVGVAWTQLRIPVWQESPRSRSRIFQESAHL